MAAWAYSAPVSVYTRLVCGSARRVLFLSAGIVLAFFIFPSIGGAANLGSLESVTNANRTITQDSAHFRTDFSSATPHWIFRFSWPHPIPNQNALLAIARGTFGALEGGVPVERSNFVVNYQAWPEGESSLGKSLSFVPGGSSLPSGRYTAIVAESPGGSNPLPLMEWFASGGTSGAEPPNYSFLEFEYNAGDRSEEIQNALSRIEYAGVAIGEGTDVYRDQFTPSPNNPSNYWRFSFSWPNQVSNERAVLAIFRGTFGTIGTPIQGENFYATNQAWPAGASAFGKFLTLPLESFETPSGTYTILLAERHALYAGEPFSDTEALWFASGGTEGHPPRRYSFFTFDFNQYRPCCSSVVFLPGFQGSVLKNGADTLWPPSLIGTAADLEALALNEHGNSVTPGISVEGILETFYSVPIYNEFTNFMDSLVPATIAHWESFAYDWRFPPETVVDESMVARIEDIALHHSLTGQVTLVTHSNGGLVGKALIKALEEAGKEELIDSFVMVGTPQLGTPQAIGGLLHGERSDISKWGYSLVSKAAARTLAHNMESAYTLLPSRAYFDTVTDPTVLFSENASYTEPWRLVWGEALGNFTELIEFLGNSGDVRGSPAPHDTQSPAVLRADLLSNADAFHAEYDAYAIPESIRVVQVAGWGLDTIKRLEYKEYAPYNFPYYVPVTTVEGDFTVVYPSALSSLGEKYFFNLDVYGNEIEHVNLFNAPLIQEEILNAVINENEIVTNAIITSIKPSPSDTSNKLLVAVHSPLTLGAYDNQGRFTGIDQNNDPEWGIQFVKNDIPNSTYFEYGEGKYLIVPEGEYTFAFEGTGAGSATIELQSLVNDEPAVSAVYSDIPVTENSTANFSVQTGENTPEIVLDIDGDGTADQLISPDSETPSLNEIIELIREKIYTSQISEKLRNRLLKHLERLEEKIAKKIERNKTIIQKIKNQVEKNRGGRIEAAQADELAIAIEELEMESGSVVLDQAILRVREKIELLDLGFSVEQSLLKRLEKIENRSGLIKLLSRITANVIKKSERGTIPASDAEEIISLIQQIESQL